MLPDAVDERGPRHVVITGHVGVKGNPVLKIFKKFKYSTVAVIEFGRYGVKRLEISLLI